VVSSLQSFIFYFCSTLQELQMTLKIERISKGKRRAKEPASLLAIFTQTTARALRPLIHKVRNRISEYLRQRRKDRKEK
jgi:hypothetical protein